jgi:aspartyl-tRNA(Asn)/glutamyl-tRNA(Gln) amidotransferase subunit A
MGKLNRGVKGLRVAWSPNLDNLPVDPEIAAVVKKAVGAFKELGAKVEEVQTKFADTYEMIRVMWGAHYAGAWGSYLPCGATRWIRASWRASRTARGAWPSTSTLRGKKIR